MSINLLAVHERDYNYNIVIIHDSNPLGQQYSKFIKLVLLSTPDTVAKSITRKSIILQFHFCII